LGSRSRGIVGAAGTGAGATDFVPEAGFAPKAVPNPDCAPEADFAPGAKADPNPDPNPDPKPDLGACLEAAIGATVLPAFGITFNCRILMPFAARMQQTEVRRLKEAAWLEKAFRDFPGCPGICRGFAG
jgi:hypothetical protein